MGLKTHPPGPARGGGLPPDTPNPNIVHSELLEKQEEEAAPGERKLQEEEELVVDPTSPVAVDQVPTRAPPANQGSLAQGAGGRGGIIHRPATARDDGSVEGNTRKKNK